MQKIDASNILFSLASDLVNHTSKNIFLTGRAGTGKTTFLKYIKENCPKQLAVVAPTGVAAINAGGVTIHSFFQLPLGTYTPEVKGFRNNEDVTNRDTLLSRLRLNNDKRKIIQELELLIIDEVSMLRCDVLDEIDLVLRHIRHRHFEPFGGVQVLFIGDVFQLPPVIKNPEWDILKEFYRSPFFFDSHVLKDAPPVYIEFAKIYRQTDEKFIHLLNKVRNNEMDEEHLKALHERYKPGFFAENAEGYILLTTHNHKATEINANELTKLPGKLFTYKAEIEGDFPENAFPAAEQLQLKVGAQVMFIKNDTEKVRRYFNGKIGVITGVSEDKISVKCNGESSPIEVSKEKWQNIRYALDKATQQVSEDVLGSFTQYPLRLAWAITIHKSQGLTFEKAVIDAGKAFASGQVYVALSRCTNLEGMVLHSKINANALFANERIVQFTKNVLPAEYLQQELTAAKKAYQEKVLALLFDFTKSVNGIKELQGYLSQHTSSFNTDSFPWCDELFNKLSSLQTTAKKFQLHLKNLFALTDKAEDNFELQARIKTAAAWFSTEIKVLFEIILQSPAITDSSIHAKEYNEMVRDVYMQLSMQNFMMLGFSGKFNMEVFHRRKKSFVAPSFGINSYAGASGKKVELAHPTLYYDLKKLRDAICSRKNLPIYYVASSKTLEEMSTYLPQTLDELEQISGFGKSKIETYGNDFLSIINKYTAENNLMSAISEKKPKRKRKENIEPKLDTKAETFRLYKEGKTVIQIAKERNLAIQTVEGHLAHYVQNGQISIEDLISREKIVLIEPMVKDFAGGSIIHIKEKLGSNVSFGEIRLVLAWIEYQRSPSHINH